MAFKEADLEKVFIDLLVQEGCKYVPGEAIGRGEGEVLIEQDLRDYLYRRYDSEGITENEIRSIVLQLRSLPASALYESNKKFCSWLSDGFMLKRENPKDKDILIELADFRPLGERRKSGFGVDDDEEAMPLAADVAAKYCADCNPFCERAPACGVRVQECRARRGDGFQRIRTVDGALPPRYSAVVCL